MGGSNLIKFEYVFGSKGKLFVKVQREMGEIAASGVEESGEELSEGQTFCTTGLFVFGFGAGSGNLILFKGTRDDFGSWDVDGNE